ncbi:phosphate ABC transporter substrate-binding protein, PhoT family [Desulfonispora thiosulfatigenes DSM 11270]|uniref:Phosphate ABC transporter substrate-binding protein, PhoT family n=1 Tax=Desulfonispora thiosulfatigenes DSM 11270 TaxID=656914 RepID=A0A1W1VF62_DESTI|nr:phosphate ABC transporter substrate-binding protein [Desulfonispora thiosulfatigenes]SMB91850.1 phosphate ABC transporter substrate-binding protein, PhoT family [Desulfonispora thiosulfatigenes DSM 11270]
MKKQISLFLSIILVAGLIVTGCGKQEAGQVFKSEITYNGSSTLAPVISALATEFMEEYVTWNKVDPDFPEENISIYVSAGGSGAGVKAALEGTSDFGMLARELKDEEKEKLGDIETFTLGIDALTVSINPQNPLNEIKDNLTLEEVKKIFSGEYKYWDDVDNSLDHKEIVVVIRDLGGGAHGVFQKKVMGDTEVREDAIQAPSMGALVTKLMENKDAIGYASFGMVNQNEGKIIPLKVDGIKPTVETIVNGTYKISRPLIVVKKGSLSKEEKAFMDMVTSTKGSEIIEKMGFVPVK